ncbi:MAG: bifunctional phosphopantothenoylcysteine decarboxylase/phosphopantothenate--cysteine ligase CoaBC [Chloroflexota bacterium]|nr:bifunctional phosphopantothenoylcysteine decarboxylase/phosphopantothenate--cysteine ligase CoaBC [Chloroflexota bacterium]
MEPGVSAAPSPDVTHPLQGARIILAVSGGIAAYKAADLASKLVQSGAVVEVILTAGGQEFVRPLTFQALTKRAVHTDTFAPWTGTSFGHITLAREAELMIVAPASANTIAKLALGLADDLLGAVALSTEAPLLLAPAMEHGMYHHPATQEHLATLLQRGATVVGPESGRLASGYEGDGRLVPVETILGRARALLGRDGPLAGKHVVVTAGGTREPLDPVRFVGNRSSGTMGYALAQAAIDRGAEVTLITTTTLSPPVSAAIVAVETAEQMRAAVEQAITGADVLIMAAAVADFRPDQPQQRKIKKRPDQHVMDLRLTQNPDIVASIDRPGLLKVGFAAETDDLVANARAKLTAKGLAMIVANDVVDTIGSAESVATIILPDRPLDELPRMSKQRLAAEIVARLLPLLDPEETAGA